jgi:putative toxin-antitoxin system antitoxin component (TIGR02293 family)
MVTIDKKKQEFGYAALVGVRTQTLDSLRQALRRGLPFGAILKFKALSGLSNIQIMALLQISTSTWARYKAAGRIKQDESERLMRTAKIYALALQLYGGNAVGVRAYMGTPNREFSGETPIQMLIASDASARRVENLLFAQLHGDVLG